MADNDLIYKIALEADGVESGAKKAEQAVASSTKNMKSTVEETGRSFEALGGAAEKGLGQLASAAGEGGRQMLELGHKIAEAAKAAGEAESLMSGLALGIAGVASAMAGLATASAGIGSHLMDLRESVRGTEGDFAKLEIMGRNTSLGIDGMVSVFTTLRTAIRDSARELRTTGEALQVLEDRQRDSVATLELHKKELELNKKEQAGWNVERQKAALASEKEAAQLERDATAVERSTAHLARYRREAEEAASPVSKLFGLHATGMDPKKILELGEAMEKLQKARGTDALREFLVQAERVGVTSDEVRKRIDAMFGPHAGRLIMEHADQLKSLAGVSDEVAEKLNQSMGSLSKEQAQALDGLKQSMNGVGEAAENMAARIGASFAPLVNLNDMFKTVSQTIEQDAEDLKGLYAVLLLVANGFLVVANAAAKMVGATDTAASTSKQIAENNKTIAGIMAAHTQYETAHPPGQAAGGLLHGPGTETSDSIPIMASRGEYVVNAGAVKHYGVGMMNAINAKGFAAGGDVQADREQREVAYAACIQKINEKMDAAMVPLGHPDRLNALMDCREKFGFASGGYIGSSFTGNRFAWGGLAGAAAASIMGSGLSQMAVNAGMDWARGVAGMHQWTINVPGTGSFGPFHSTSSVVDQLSRVAGIQRMTSAGRPAASWG